MVSQRTERNSDGLSKLISVLQGKSVRTIEIIVLAYNNRPLKAQHNQGGVILNIMFTTFSG